MPAPAPYVVVLVEGRLTTPRAPQQNEKNSYFIITVRFHQEREFVGCHATRHLFFFFFFPAVFEYQFFMSNPLE